MHKIFRSIALQSFVIVVGLLLTFIALFLSDFLAPQNGWFSSHLQIRQQTEALLDSRIALESDPSFVDFNYLWDNGRVQQVWGLGLAIWRIPFDLSASILGWEGFPDRIAFGVALLIFSCFTCRLIIITIGSSGSDQKRSLYSQFHVWFVSVVLLILFPPFLSLLYGRFSVYEEVQAYSYMISVLLLVGTLMFYYNPKISSYLALAVLSGMVPLVRPTLGAYGIATFCIIAAYGYRQGVSRWTISFGVILFLIGSAIVAASNFQRFGNVFEFGHSLNLNPHASMRYISRFDNPYREERFHYAYFEIVHWLFYMDREEYRLRYDEGIVGVAEESNEEFFRFRGLNSFTFDITYSAPIIVLLGWLTFANIRRWKRKREYCASEVEILGLWCLLSVLPLLCFYLWFPVLYSRYLLDFAPAFSAGFVGVIWLFKRSIGARIEFAMRCVIVVGVLVWWGIQIDRIHAQGVSESSTITHDELGRLLNSEVSVYRKMPAVYETSMEVHEYVNQFNGSGWNSRSGNTRASIALFVEEPEFLELTVAPVSGVELAPEDYEIIRAKVGLEFLELESMTPTEEGMVLRFSGPRRKRYQGGIQVVFVAFMTGDELHESWSRFRLLRVRWNDASLDSDDRP